MLGTASKPELDHVDVTSLNSVFQLPYQACRPVGGLIPVLSGECVFGSHKEELSLVVKT